MLRERSASHPRSKPNESDQEPDEELAHGDAPESEPLARTGEPGAKGSHGTYEQALARHQRNSAYLDNLVTSGLNNHKSSAGILWPNTCQWLKSGKTKLVALTKTHDAEARAQAFEQPGRLAYFGIDDAVPRATDYPREHNDNRNTVFRQADVVASQSDGTPSTISVVEPTTFSEGVVATTLIHEVSHAADTHDATRFGNYRSEFDAYWIAQQFDQFSDESGTADESLQTKTGEALTGFDNARQQRIFRSLYDAGGSYDYVSWGWSLAPENYRTNFRALVLGRTRPVGTNLLNSPRIDDVYLALQARPQDLMAIKAAVERLTKPEAEAMRQGKMREAWRAFLKERSTSKDIEKQVKQWLSL